MRPHWGICPATSCTRQRPDRPDPECTARSHTATQEGSEEREHTVAAGQGANRIAKWGSHMVVGTKWWEVMWAQRADHWDQTWGLGWWVYLPWQRSQPHLGVVQGEKGLQVGDEVGVDALQRLQQRNSHHLRKRLFDLRPLLVKVKAPGREPEGQRSHNRALKDLRQHDVEHCCHLKACNAVISSPQMLRRQSCDF